MARKQSTCPPEPNFIPCKPMRPPEGLHLIAAQAAVRENPVNAPLALGMIAIIGEPGATPTIPLPSNVPLEQHIAGMTTRFWLSSDTPNSSKPKVITCAFLDSPSVTLANKIISFANLWSSSANIKFTLTKSDPIIRIARTPGDGHYSYLGTDALIIPKNQKTMNLDSFTLKTEESEYYRVICHEFGHALGFFHEHLRREMVARLDPAKTIAYGARVWGWPEYMVRQQVLTPIDDKLLTSTLVDQDSIMCYQLPGDCTVDGQPIRGGMKIDTNDYAFAARVYPGRKSS